MTHETIQQNEQMLITLPKRGLRIVPPDETRRNMERAKNGEIVHWSEEEKIRLKMVRDCSILAKRHPSPENGQEYMAHVDYGRQEVLTRLAQELTSDIAYQWHRINPNSDIAILLFGSVAKGLVRNADHPDPSNIDLAVIGNIRDIEREKLFDRIKAKRSYVKGQILASCPSISSPEANPGNAGVIIQDISKVVKGDYNVARTYIAGGARPLYDPGSIWKPIETAALHSYESFVASKQRKKHA